MTTVIRKRATPEPAAPDRIATALAHLVALERAIEAQSVAAGDELTHEGATALIADVGATAVAHQQALCARLADIAPAVEAPDLSEVPSFDGLGIAELHLDSSVLGATYALLQRAIIGYATMQTLSHRLRDSWVVASEGTAAHIAREHVQTYLDAAGRIASLLPDVVVWELDSQGALCGCTCPACGFGLCLCPTTARAILGAAWAAAQPANVEVGIPVPLPRAGSAAATAGILAGDCILAVDGTRVDAVSAVQHAIRGHGPGDPVRFKVQRGEREVVLLGDVRRDVEITENEDDCLLPDGQQFSLANASRVRTNLKARLNGDAGHAAALAALTPRETQVLRLAAEGATNPRIADQLEISRATVKSHMRNILGKLGVPNRTEAASLAAANGLLEG